MKLMEDHLKKALDELAAEKKSQDKGGCPPEEILALYMEGGLAGKEKDRVMEHLSFCSDCLDIVAMEASAEGELSAEGAGATVPSRAVDRAKNLVRSGTDETLFDIVVRLGRGTLEIIHSALQPLPPVYQPAHAALRSSDEEQAPEPLWIEKVFNGLSAELQLGSSQEGLCNIQVFLKTTEGGPLPGGLRVTLKDLPMGKELQSAPVRDGVAVFSGLNGGEYELEIREQGNVVGTASIRLTE